MLSKHHNRLPIKTTFNQLACMAGIQKGCGRESGCESAKRGGGWKEFPSAHPHVPFALLAHLESPPGEYCQIWAKWVCATAKGMVFKQFTLG